MADASTIPHSPLASLGAHLSARGFTIDLAADGLHVTAPRTAGGTPRQRTEIVHCRSRGEDFGNRWFFTGDGHPIASADRIVDAAVFITGHLSRDGRGVGSAGCRSDGDRVGDGRGRS